MSRAMLGVRPEVVEDVAVRALPRRPLAWPMRVVVVSAIALMAGGLAAVTDRVELLVLVVIVAAVIIAALIVFGHRAWQRGRSIDLMIEAVNSVVRASAPTRDLVTVSRWRGGWIGAPQRIVIRYPGDLVDSDLKFAETLVVQVSNRMGIAYRVKKNDARRCLITLTADPAAPEPVVDPDQSRLESVLSVIIPGVSVDEFVRDNADNLQRTILHWPPTSTSRVSKTIWQKQAVDAVRSSVVAPNAAQLTIDWDLTADRGTVRPLTPLPDVLPHPPRDDDNPMKIAFGHFRDGTPCVWDLDAPLPHLLIVGGTGGGKTVLLLSILTALPTGMRRDAFGQWVRDPDMPMAEIWPIDPKRLGLFNLGLLPGAKPAATREAAIVTYILKVKKLMDDRYEYLERNGPHLRSTLDPLVLAVDEGEEMADMLNEWWKSGGGKADWCQRMGLEKAPTGSIHPVMTAFGSILRLGREARVHVILASQQAAASWLSTSSRSQFAVRIALRNLEQSTSMMTFGSLVATAGLENKPGRAWVSPGMGIPPEHAQIFWTPKLAQGLGDEDRAIMHELGITLPDDPDFVPQDDVVQVPTEHGETEDVAETSGEEDAGRPHLYAVEDSTPIEEENVRSFELSVSELDVGMSILVDVDGEGVIATVESIDVDLEDQDYLILTYLTEDGEKGEVAVPDDEQVTILIPE